MKEKAVLSTFKPEEIKVKIIELARKGIPAEKIGLVLRDQEGIPSVKTAGIKIKQVLQQEGLWKEISPVYEKKLENLKKHSEKNKHDYTAQRSLVKNTRSHQKAVKENSA